MPYRVTEIDQTYPEAGVDNESQGFRDNFSAIKDTLAQAKTDIESLQTTRLDTTDTISDINNNTLENVNLKNASFEFFTAGGGTVADQDIDFTNGAYQVITCAKASPSTGAPLIFTFTNFPENERYALIRVQVFGNDDDQFFNFASEGDGTFYYSDNWPTTLSVTGILAPQVFEFWTYDGGQSVYARYLGEFVTT
jgi:hypothetical protein